MTPEQRARFDAGTPSEMALYEARKIAYECITIGITLCNKALLESAESIVSRINHMDYFVPIDALEIDNLYSCIVAENESTMCVLLPTHPVRTAEKESCNGRYPDHLHDVRPILSGRRCVQSIGGHDFRNSFSGNSRHIDRTPRHPVRRTREKLSLLGRRELDRPLPYSA